MTEHHKLLILGSGPGGYTAAIYAARAGLAPTLITGPETGGQLTTTTDVENWPGSEEGLQGPDLMDTMRRQTAHCGARLIEDTIVEAKLDEKPFQLTGGSVVYSCDALIIATGASARYLGLESEAAYLGKGVSACATCDGFFFRGKRVAVIGGGNTAVEEALYLSGLAKEVFLVHRRDRLRAEEVLQQRLLSQENIQPLWNQVLLEVLGDGRFVTGARLGSTTDQSTQDLDVDGVFIAIGHDPNTGVFAGQLQMRGGYLEIRGGQNGGVTSTSIPGVFAAGDVADSVYRQAVTSAGFGCMAALDAKAYLDGLH